MSVGVEKKGEHVLYFSEFSLTHNCLLLAGNLHAAVGKRLYSYFSDAGKWETFPETRRALERLRDSGLKLGAVSNFDERLGS